MARQKKNIVLNGFLSIGGKKFLRSLVPKLSGQYKRGLMLIEMTGNAPGGFPPVQMQVPVKDFKLWLDRCNKWMAGVTSWEELLKTQKAEAESILDEMPLEQR